MNRPRMDGFDVIPRALGAPGCVPREWRGWARCVGHGLAEVLERRDRGDRRAPAARPGCADPASGVLNGPAVAAYAARLADAIGAVLDSGARAALVLGGDCSVLLGGALALRRGRRRRAAVPRRPRRLLPARQAEPSGEAASMDLALVTGHGPTAVSDVEGRSRSCAPSTRWLSGSATRRGSRPATEASLSPPSCLALDLAAVRAPARPPPPYRALVHLTRPGAPERIWLHVDADVSTTP